MATARQPNFLPLHDFPQPPADASPRRAEYFMLDLVGNVLQGQRMSASEARDTNLELEALDVPYLWVRMADLID